MESKRGSSAAARGSSVARGSKAARGSNAAKRGSNNRGSMPAAGDGSGPALDAVPTARSTVSILGVVRGSIVVVPGRGVVPGMRSRAVSLSRSDLSFRCATEKIQ